MDWQTDYTAPDLDTLGPCGCTDYHLADCPTRTGGTGATFEDLLERGLDDLDEDWR